MKQNNKLILFLVLLIVCLVIVLLPHQYRDKYEGGNLIGEETYLNLRLASDPLLKYDELSYEGRELAVERGLPLILFLNPEMLSRWLPTLLGILSFLLFFFLIKDNFLAFFSALIFILSPQFIYAFSTSIKYTVIIPIFLLLLTFRKKEIVSYIIGGLIFLFDFFSGIIGLCVIYYFIEDKKKVLIPAAIGLVFTYFNFYNLKNFTLNTFIYFPDEVKNYIHLIFSDLGSFSGLGIFTFFIAVIGVYFLWKDDLKFIGIYIIAIILLVSSIFFNSLLFLLSIPVAYLASITFKELFNSTWESKSLKHIIIALLFCGVLFSGVAFEDRLLASEPTAIKMQAVDFLSTLKDQATVLSSDENGHLITYSGHKSFIDKNYLFIKDLKERKEISEKILFSPDKNTIHNILQQNKIKYILLDEKMKSFDLLTILENDKKFSKIYDKFNIQIWGVEL